jgi:hypothetical protein
MGKNRNGLIALSGADEDGQATGRGHQGGGGWQDVLEAFYGAEGDCVEGCGEGFGAGVLYIDVGQCKGASHFAEESGLLVVGLDEGKGNVRSPEFDGEAGESGAGAYVGEGVNTFHHRGH